MGYKQWKIVTLTINTHHSTPITNQLLAFARRKEITGTFISYAYKQDRWTRPC